VRLLGLLGLGVVVVWFALRSSSPTVVPADPDAEARMRAAQAYSSGRVVHALEDRGEGDDAVLRDNPKALFALRQALREAVSEAKAVGGGADPLELLAHKLLARAGAVAVSEPMPATVAVNASVAAPTPARGGPGTSAPNGGLPAKFPSAGMWPTRDTGGPGVRSPNQSVGKLEPYRGGDLEAPGELRRAAAARSFNGEIILTYGNEAGTAWFANLAFSLRTVGIEHFLVIVSLGYEGGMGRGLVLELGFCIGTGPTALPHALLPLPQPPPRGCFAVTSSGPSSYLQTRAPPSPTHLPLLLGDG
jgi:hypothetical protein